MFPIWLLGRWRSEPGAMCMGKNRRGGGRGYRYWYIKAKADIKRRKTRVDMLAECYREDGHLRGEWVPNAKVTGSPALSASPCGLPGYASGDKYA